MSSSVGKYLKPEVIDQVKRLDLRAKFIVEGFISGLHGSPFQGFSVEFSEHRKYEPGDELNTIDWNVFAKTDRYYVKKFQAETNMTCHLVVDMSRSMAFSYGDGLNKLDYAISLAASMGYMMIHQQDPVGLVTFDEKIRAVIPPKSKRSHLTQILSELAKTDPKGQTNLADSIHRVAELIRGRGLVVLFSDLLADTREVIDAFHHLRFKGHDVIVFHILDVAELKMPFNGIVEFEDMETGSKVRVSPDAIRDNYLKQMKVFLDGYEEQCTQAQIDYVLIDTSVSFDKALISFLSRRMRRG